MGALELLQHLRGAGLYLAATAEGGLRVSPSSKLDDADRQAIRANKAELLALLVAPQQYEAQRQPETELSLLVEVADLKRATRRWYFMRWFHDEREIERQLARLARRDANGDDHRMCLECCHLLDGGRCLAASRGQLRGTDKRLEPVRDILQRCEAFGLRKGLA